MIISLFLPKIVYKSSTNYSTYSMMRFVFIRLNVDKEVMKFERKCRHLFPVSFGSRQYGMVMADSTDEAVTGLEEIRSLVTGHEGPVRAVRFNSDGNYCLTCGSDKTLRLSNPHKGTLLKTYIGHGYEVLDAIAAYENDKIASCGADKTVVLWDVATGKCIRKFRGHLGVCGIICSTLLTLLCEPGCQQVLNWPCYSP